MPHSGLQELDWGQLAPLAFDGSRGAQQRNRARDAVLEETQRRIANLREEWESDQEHYHSSRVVNLSLYKPSFPVGLPQGFSLALPFWGFLTIGAAIAEHNRGKSGAGRLGLESQEAAVVSGAWIAQLRSLLGLQPGNTLANLQAAAPCNTALQSGFCGRECERQRCLWQVQNAASPDASAAAEPWPALDFPTSAVDFAPAPTNAMLVSTDARIHRKVMVYLHPSTRGLAEWELGALAADFHFSMVRQAAENIRVLRELLSNHTDIRVPAHVGQAIQVRRSMREVLFGRPYFRALRYCTPLKWHGPTSLQLAELTTKAALRDI